MALACAVEAQGAVAVPAFSGGIVARYDYDAARAQWH